MFERLEVLTANQCADAVRSVLALRRLWRARDAQGASHTLGAASYLDVPAAGLSGYLTATVRTRRRLDAAFSPLYEALTRALGAHLGGPVKLHPTLGRPGFHIFEALAIPADFAPKVHFDLQHRHFHWDDPRVSEPGRRLSFTLALELPATGGGLYLWPITEDGLADLSESDARARIEATSPTFVDYAVGALVVHSGDWLHQIAADRPAKTGDRRLTLQGHGVREHDAWWLYW